MSLCGCGCGLPTPIATRNRKDRGHVKGEPVTYRQDHPQRRFPPPRQPLRGERGTEHYWLCRRYGIGIEEYDAMVAAQDGRCLICDRERKLVVDHEHETGRVRGLLCITCNSQLGFFEKFEGRVREYLG